VISSSQRSLPNQKINTHKRQKTTPPVGLDPAIQVIERPQTYALDRAATDEIHIFIKKLTVSTLQTDGTNYKKVHSQKLHAVYIVVCRVTRMCTFILSLIFNMHILKIEFFKDMKFCHWFSYRRLVGQRYFRNYGN